MHNRAKLIIKDGVILVLAILRKALITTLAQTMEITRAEVPAARTLQQISADRRHVANLRRGGMLGCFGERCVTLAYGFVRMQLRERNQRTDTQAIAVFGDL